MTDTIKRSHELQLLVNGDKNAITTLEQSIKGSDADERNIAVGILVSNLPSLSQINVDKTLRVMEWAVQNLKESNNQLLLMMGTLTLRTMSQLKHNKVTKQNIKCLLSVFEKNASPELYKMFNDLWKQSKQDRQESLIAEQERFQQTGSYLPAGARRSPKPPKP